MALQPLFRLGNPTAGETANGGYRSLLAFWSGGACNAGAVTPPLQAAGAPWWEYLRRDDEIDALARGAYLKILLWLIAGTAEGSGEAARLAAEVSALILAGQATGETRAPGAVAEFVAGIAGHAARVEAEASPGFAGLSATIEGVQPSVFASAIGGVIAMNVGLSAGSAEGDGKTHEDLQ
jgi:hypothetical protein